MNLGFNRAPSLNKQEGPLSPELMEYVKEVAYFVEQNRKDFNKDKIIYLPIEAIMPMSDEDLLFFEEELAKSNLKIEKTAHPDDGDKKVWAISPK